MEYTVILYEEARKDILEIIKWYDLKQLGVAEKFEERLEEAILKLNKRPNSFSLLYNDVRRIYLKRFPYLIFYKIVEQHVFIYGVIHAKRNPAVYKRRLRKLL